MAMGGSVCGGMAGWELMARSDVQERHTTAPQPPQGPSRVCETMESSSLLDRM